MSKQCDHCGAEFEPFSKRSRFCCERCKSTWNNAHKAKHTLVCQGCGATFESVIASAKYCSVSCGLRHSVPVKTCVCVDCGKAFEFKGRTKREHCPDCAPAWESRRQMQWRASKDATIKLGVGSGGAQWGSDNHAWKPTDEHVSLRYRANWRKRCFKLWPKSCCACGSLNDIEVHHVDGDPSNFNNGNLIPLCFECHIHRIHTRRYATPAEYVQATLAILSQECRDKIAALNPAAAPSA